MMTHSQQFGSGLQNVCEKILHVEDPIILVKKTAAADCQPLPPLSVLPPKHTQSHYDGGSELHLNSISRNRPPPNKTKKFNPKKTPTGERPIPRKRLQCGNCSVMGHVLVDCTRNIDKYGFLNGCPKCNTLEHNYSACTLRKRAGDDYHYLVQKRHGKPPIRSMADFRYVDETKWRASIKGFRPQTCQFAAERLRQGLIQDIGEEILDPLWDFPHAITSQVHPLDVACQAPLTSLP